MALYPRRVTSTSTTISVIANDGTSYLSTYHPNQYKGNQTFSTLSAVAASIGSGGGWAPLGLTTFIRDVMPTASGDPDSYDTIAPRPVMRQDALTKDVANQTAVWESAAWNGYGWFWIPSGGHRTGYRNDMYMVRIADPIQVVRLYNTSPPIAATWRGGGPNPAGVPISGVIHPSYWNQYQFDQCDGFPEWGPYGEHHYDGIQFDPVTEKVIWGGDVAREITNPFDYGSVRQVRNVLSVFDVNAGTPKSAWSRLPLPPWGISNAVFGMCDRNDGTYEFSGYYSGGSGGARCKYNPVTHTLDSSPPFNTSSAVDFGHAFRDPATNKFYETQGAGSSSTVFDLTAGSTIANIGLFEDQPWGDATSAPIVVNSKSYHFGFTAAATNAYKTPISLAASRINLATGVRDLALNGLTVYLQPLDKYPDGAAAGTPGYAVNGLHGRVGWVPSVGVFVILLSALHDVYVFRPPSSWGTI